jgi:hypothetical protein
MSALHQRFLVLVALAATTLALASPGDGFATGSVTPEGAACDFARAFIQRDASLFEQVSLMPFGGGESRAEYESFLKETKAAILEEAKRPADRGPRKIVKVFVARSMSRSGPASYGYASFGFADVKFVDVVVDTYDSGTTINRTLVVKDNTGHWGVHPAPGIHPMLSAGLNDESPSTLSAETPNTSLERSREK